MSMGFQPKGLDLWGVFLGGFNGNLVFEGIQIMEPRSGRVLVAVYVCIYGIPYTSMQNSIIQTNYRLLTINGSLKGTRNLATL